MSEFFNIKHPKQPAPTEIRCYYNTEGRVTHFAYKQVDVCEENYIVVTNDEYDAAMMKAELYIVEHGKLVYNPPKYILWYLEQSKLNVNPYIME